MARKYFQAQVTEVRDLCSVVKHVGFERVDGQPVTYTGGQFMMVHFPNADGVEINRSYSMSDPAEVNDGFSLCVKIVDGGQGSTLIHGLAVGDNVKMSGPYGKFTLTPTPPKDIVFVATGTGMAPFRAMRTDFEPLLSVGHRVWMLMGVRHADEMLYDAEWQALAEAHPEAFNYRRIVSQPHAGTWTGPVGYVSDFVGELEATIDPTDAIAYLCGVPQMVDGMRKALMDMGMSMRAVRAEKYASPPPPRKK